MLTTSRVSNCLKYSNFLNSVIFNQVKKFNVFFGVKQRVKPADYISKEDIESPLWFTNLPSKRKRARVLNDKKTVKLKKLKTPTGPLLISSKRKEFNQYLSTHYGKFDTIPLVSKGWHHPKSNGDFFSILPTTSHPAFLMSFEDSYLKTTFNELGLTPQLIQQLQKIDVHNPTTIQAKSIPAILEGNSVMIIAETGCGKTLAYLAPIVDCILKLKKLVSVEANSPLALILLPSRELAIQVGAVAYNLCSDLGIRTLTLLGGKTKKMLLYPEKHYTDILISTPGVLSKMLTAQQYSFNFCKHLVLDEGDTLLDDSFSYRVKYIIKKSKMIFGRKKTNDPLLQNSQFYLVSATQPKSLDSILEHIVTREYMVEISTKFLHKIQPHILQEFLRVGQQKKPEQLLKIVKRNVKNCIPTMIFCNKTPTVIWLYKFLQENSIDAILLNGKMRYEERLKQYQNFREGQANILCCTDVASRGLDCTRVKHVINYEFPRFMADYIHRCGRTGRIGHDENCVITNFISSKKELSLLQEIEKAARTALPLDNVNNNIARIIKNRT